MAISVFKTGNRKVEIKSASGHGTAYRYTCYAPFSKSSHADFAEASGNGIAVHEEGEYRVFCVGSATYGFGTNTCNLTITQPGESDIVVSGGPSSTKFNYWWSGKLKADSVLTLAMVNTYSGSSSAYLTCILEVTKVG